LFQARTVSPWVEPTTTWKRGSALIWASASAAGNSGDASTSPASRAAVAALGSAMNLKLALSSLAGVHH